MEETYYFNENEKETQNDIFSKGLNALKKTDSDYIGGILSTNGTYGKLELYNKAHIVNAHIHIKSEGFSNTWVIENGVSQSIPSTLAFWLRSTKKMAIYFQRDNSDESYIFFGFKDFPVPKDCVVWGIVEDEYNGLVFYMDSESDHVLCIQDSSDSSPMLFKLLKKILYAEKQEETFNGLHTSSTFTL